MKVVVLGKGLMLANIVLGVLDSGADLVGVFRYESTCTNPVKLFFRDFFVPSPEVTLLKQIKAKKIRMKSANAPTFRKLMRTLNVDLIIVGTWKERLEKETFNIPTIASVNIHPSLLPRYRGPNPYIQTILHGEEFSGVTVHLISENFDEGPILKQEKIKILDSDTSKELREKSVRMARTLVSELITDLNEKMLTPIAQNSKYATYFPNITGDEKMLDFTFQSSVEISRTVRALHPFLPCYIQYGDKFFIVNPYSFKILSDKFDNYIPGDVISKNPDKKSITVVCSDKTAISFSRLKLYGSKSLTRQFIQNEVKVITR